MGVWPSRGVADRAGRVLSFKMAGFLPGVVKDDLHPRHFFAGKPD
jgi:hypothetical protein